MHRVKGEIICYMLYAVGWIQIYFDLVCYSNYMYFMYSIYASDNNADIVEGARGCK